MHCVLTVIFPQLDQIWWKAYEHQFLDFAIYSQMDSGLSFDLAILTDNLF